MHISFFNGYNPISTTLFYGGGFKGFKKIPTLPSTRKRTLLQKRLFALREIRPFLGNRLNLLNGIVPYFRVFLFYFSRFSFKVSVRGTMFYLIVFGPLEVFLCFLSFSILI